MGKSGQGAPPSPVPKGEGPGAPSAWLGTVGIGATRHVLILNKNAAMNGRSTGC